MVHNKNSVSNSFPWQPGRKNSRCVKDASPCTSSSQAATNELDSDPMVPFDLDSGQTNAAAAASDVPPPPASSPPTCFDV